eukprot:TRINITY_DN934_c4_g1_i1.p1 TRINITY_DN934_c4_g1~~TRINITY_DN934_c4_g1_i1.p1  ORF type:complete len:380 (+),score=184.64 TRINITY_DN934_c4_g1_i1:169-1308(+)
MSSQTAIPVSVQLTESFKSAENGNNIRFIQVSIVNEELVISNVFNATGSVSADFNRMSSFAQEGKACYFLFKKDASKSWLIITFVSPTTPVRDKMVYAATKGTLKDKLGHQHFIEEVHANNTEELTWAFYEGSHQPVNALSHQEQQFREMIKQEEQERTDRKSGAKSGYHSVNMALSSSAADLIANFIASQINFVELAIDSTGKRAINGTAGRQVNSLSELATITTKTEPRYYLFKHTGKTYFIYLCPDASPANLRMVYSTTKASVPENGRNLGLLVDFRLEVRDGSDLTADYLRSAVNPSLAAVSTPAVANTNIRGRGGLQPGGRGASWQSSETTAAKNVNKVDTPHPIYSLINQGESNNNTRNPNSKKVVIPPQGAW